MISFAVLASITFKVGINIIDWRFLKRAYLISGKGALITYGVIALTVFFDLITAVGIGLFVTNIMTNTQFSKLQADDVKEVTDPDMTDLQLSAHESELHGDAHSISRGRISYIARHYLTLQKLSA